MSAPDAPVVEVLRARLAPRLATLRAGLAPPAALLDLAVRRVELPVRRRRPRAPARTGPRCSTPSAPPAATRRSGR